MSMVGARLYRDNSNAMSNNLKAILAGGLIAGTIDIGAAVALYHIGPIRGMAEQLGAFHIDGLRLNRVIFAGCIDFCGGHSNS